MRKLNLENQGKIINGDCLVVMKTLPNECIDLIYLDPPFGSNKTYDHDYSDKRGRKLSNEFQDIDFDSEELDKDYKNRWEGDNYSYINWLRPRLGEMYRILKATGSIYFHCDWHASHYIKVEMDKIFGVKNFQNEIIWHYHTGGASKNRFSRKHDNILFYSKSNKYMFETQKEPFREDKTNHFTEIDDEGRKYRIREINGKQYKYFLDEGKTCDDVWDISAVNAVAGERLGYPTQKPEALLDRIIRASSNHGDIMFDPFCGCGTSTSVAQKTGRKFIGIDINPIAIKVVEQRLNDNGLKFKDTFDVEGIPVTLKELKKMDPWHFHTFVCNKMGARNINYLKFKSMKEDDKPDVELVISDEEKDVSKDIRGVSEFIRKQFDGALIRIEQTNTIKRSDILDLNDDEMDDLPNKVAFLVAPNFDESAQKQVDKYQSKQKAFITLITLEELIKMKEYDYTNEELNSAYDIFIES